jgi:hypothetical protein
MIEMGKAMNNALGKAKPQRFEIILATPIDRTDYEIPDLLELMLPVSAADQHVV